MDETQPDDDLEITDLPGGSEYRSARTPAFIRSLASRPRARAGLWQSATVGLMLALLFVVLSGNSALLQEHFASLFTHPSPTPGSISHPEDDFIVQDIVAQNGTPRRVLVWMASTPPVVSPSLMLAPAPQTCLNYTPLRGFDAPSYPPGVGGGPVWVTGFSGLAGQPAILRVDQLARLTQAGWIQHLHLMVATNLSGSITLQGGVANSGLPLWFAAMPLGNLPHAIELSNVITISLSDGSTSNQTSGTHAWNVFPISLFISLAGCYYLTATWYGGSWTAYFAAGR